MLNQTENCKNLQVPHILKGWGQKKKNMATFIQMGLDPTPIASHGSGFSFLMGGGEIFFSYREILVLGAIASHGEPKPLWRGSQSGGA